jgi:F0F1-type ATP synthase assembly protein I
MIMAVVPDKTYLVRGAEHTQQMLTAIQQDALVDRQYDDLGVGLIAGIMLGLVFGFIMGRSWK